MRKSFIIGGGIVLLIILVFGVYFFAYRNKSDDLITKRNNLQSSLTTAEGKLSKEKQTLDTMINGLSSSFPLAVSIQDQIKKVSDLVKQTNFLFTDPEGLNPQFIVRNLSSSTFRNINSERENINLLISAWQKETELLSIKNIDISKSEKIKKDAETIKTFIEDLSEIVGNLTPGNSGLSQFQINTYSSELPSMESINEIIISIETAIENANNDNSQISDTQTEDNLEGDNIPLVTPEEVIAQQAVISEAQTEVTVLQEQLAQVEQQIVEQSFPDPTETDTNNTISSDLENQGVENENNVNNFIPPYNTDINPKIIIQPGPPRLIEGSNQY